MSKKLTILFSGMIAGDPYQGGASWAVLQYVLGLRALGHDVYFVEPLKASADQTAAAAFGESPSAKYFRQVMTQFDLSRSSSLLLTGTRQTVGIDYDGLLKICERADLLINISGMLRDERLTSHIPMRVYLDLDPAFNQLWQTEGIDMRFAGHTHFVTIGKCIGQPGCDVPTCDLTWITTLQPVVLSFWPMAEAITHDALTTIGNWRAYGSIHHNGVFYGQKAHSLRQFIELPRLTSEKFQLAMAIHPGETRDLEALGQNGWQLLDPARLATTPDAYRQFIQQSKAEFGIAKSGYVVSQCGWFSDRSVCYLASGRPVIAQETGFSQFLPTGAGLFSFKTADDVLTAIEALRQEYRTHAVAARQLAIDYFDSGKVLTRLLDEVGALS